MPAMHDAHAADLQAGAHEPHDDHAHASGALGPLDLGAWGAGVLGVAIGLVITFCFILATA